MLISFAAGRLGWPTWTCDVDRCPADWLGDHEHTHQAIDDARGYARLLSLSDEQERPSISEISSFMGLWPADNL
jgi:hypothetical protein